MKKASIHVTESHAGINHELRWDGGRQIVWEASDGTVRVPEEKHKEFLYPGPFFAAGKAYVSWKELCVEQEDSGLCRDTYGREVFCMSELFPCFDSYDYANEHRYYRWFFLREKGKLTRVYYADERYKIEVTEDVAALENNCREQLQSIGWIR